MSSTVAVVRQNVRYHTHDTDPKDYAIDSDELNRIILAKSQEMAGEVLPGMTWNLTALTTSSGSPSATYSGNVESIVDLRRAVDGALLKRASESNIEALRDGVLDTATGKPQWYYIYETAANLVTVRFWPIPDAAYVIEALISTTPTGPGGAIAIADSTVIPFGEMMIRAIEKACAIECVAKMTGDHKVRLKLGDAIVSVWQRDVASLVAKERSREARRGRVAHIAPAVW